MYAVKNEDDKLFVVRSNDSAYLYQDQNGNLGRMIYLYYSRKDAQHAIERAGHVNQCHVVQLVEKPQPVEVSEAMAYWLNEAKEMRMPIEFLARCKVPDGDQEDILCAYVNGWTVEKPKRWNVKVPHSRFYYWKWKDDEIGVGSGEDDDVRGVEPYRFTDAEVERYGLQDCEKEEVTDDDD
ncbi:DUF1642 domain-containing protein [Lacticaseibacillus nasuensis]|uniref:DUF1642 domain-containing protein n=1 Tax=Lacticaseibacillus nasuensis TaxID=944671 RepID=UPI0022473324|nr:DUF1642 domain-containing protein [Lacticaseibacillus nasuensis]MCX2455645.1 DUF1642 domain-containing protein [Lacticaseibacillus nasuensis]